MKRFISFGSIEQFRTIVQKIQRQSQFKGLDENGEPIIDKDAKLPTVIVTGSEKIHGTNGSICYSNPDGFWVQSRKNIITPEKDNAGCALTQETNKDVWMDIINALAKEYNINLDENIISIYFEWAGGNIQKNACVSRLDKMAFIFQHFKVSPRVPLADSDGQIEPAEWHETKLKDIVNPNVRGYDEWVDMPEHKIYNIMNFPTYTLEVDFNRPDIAQNKMIEITENIEKNSGVAQAFNKSENIGEGIVWTFIDEKGNRQVWKVKGEKHAKETGKVKTLKPVDTELENKKIKFVNEIACQEFRLDQMFTEIKNSTHNGEASQMSMKDMGDYLRLVIKDVIKEHLNEMSEQGLEPKMLNSMISKVARVYFQDRLNKEVGL